MLSWMESLTVGVVIVGGAYLIFREIYSILNWRFERHTQITEACNNIDNAFENAKREEHS